MKSIMHGTAFTSLGLTFLGLFALAGCAGEAPPAPPHEVPCTTGTPVLPPASFHRFVGPAPPGEAWRAHKQYVGREIRSVLFAPNKRPPFTTQSDADGFIVLTPGEDFDWPDPLATGISVRTMHQTMPLHWLDKAPKKRRFVPRDSIDSGPLQLAALEPGKEGREVRVWVRSVWPARQTHTTETVRVPPFGRLDVGFGLEQGRTVKKETALRVRISVLEGKKRTTLFEETAAIRPDYGTDNRWHDVSLDLAACAGKGVRFVFESEPAGKVPPEGIPLVLWGTPTLCSSRGARVPPPPNLLFICLDTLRPDHLGCYGYHRPTSPNLDRFAADAMLFEQAVTAASWTTPSHASVFTGLHAGVHQAGVWSGGYNLGGHWLTLAELAADKDYLTAAFTEGVAVKGVMGFAQGFDRYSDGIRGFEEKIGAMRTTFGEARQWLDRYGHLPFFLFVHTYQIHEPYGVPEPLEHSFTDPAYAGKAGALLEDAKTEEDRKHTVNVYDDGIVYADQILGSFLEAVTGMGLFENTVIVVFSDHGEEFWEHGSSGHTSQMYDEVLKTVLVVRMPGRESVRGRVQRQVGLTDLFATTAALLGSTAVAPQSHSLLPFLEPAKAAGGYDRNLVSSQLLCLDEDLSQRWGEFVEWKSLTVRSSKWKYHRSDKVWVLDRAETAAPSSQVGATKMQGELFDLETDPSESMNLLNTRPKEATRMDSLLNKALQGAFEGVKLPPDYGSKDTSLSNEDVQGLAALGYL